MPSKPKVIHDVKYYMAFARKNTLRQLQLLIPMLKGQDKELAESAAHQFEMNLRNRPLK